MFERWTPESLVRAYLHGEARHEPDSADTCAVPPTPTIAISRQFGAHGSEIAREVARRLGWSVYDRELLEGIAQDMQVRVSLLESVDERHVSWLEEFAEAFLLGSKVSENSYVMHLVETIVSLAARGQCVIVGRGAALVLPPSCTLRVRVVAAREDRITTLCHERSVTTRAAEHELDSIERQQLRFVKDHFQRDAADPANYDLVLNSSRWSIEQCADMIVDALHRLSKRRAALHPALPRAIAEVDRSPART
ncbi:MAG TPA: cytidylate kinase-like family protein [Pirellulales bacterium]|nr:cytidylate kinase-like family protein [Pirellulales bacterium]